MNRDCLYCTLKIHTPTNIRFIKAMNSETKLIGYVLKLGKNDGSLNEVQWIMNGYLIVIQEQRGQHLDNYLHSSNTSFHDFIHEYMMHNNDDLPRHGFFELANLDD